MQLYNIEAEKNLLGAILIDQFSIENVIDIISATDFFDIKHQAIFGSIVGLYLEGISIDLITVSNKCAMLGISPFDVSILVDSIHSSANITNYAHIVKDHAIRRALVKAAENIIELSQSDIQAETLINQAENEFNKVTHTNISTSIQVNEILSETFNTLINPPKDDITGLKTGFRELDKITSGFQNSDLIIVAGRPAMGKTAFAINCAMHVAINQKKPIFIFSLEMSKKQLVNRMLCSQSRINQSQINQSHELDNCELIRINKTKQQLEDALIFIDDKTNITITEIKAKAKQIQKKHGLGAIIIDYLQLMSGNNPKNREREVAELSRALKCLAKELNIPVIALSQLNRSLESRIDKRPQLSDLRESGAIEQDADLILFLYRDEVYNPSSSDKMIAELIVGKHRSGPIGTIRVGFSNIYTRFFDIITI